MPYKDPEKHRLANASEKYKRQRAKYNEIFRRLATKVRRALRAMEESRYDAVRALLTPAEAEVFDAFAFRPYTQRIQRSRRKRA